MSALTIEFFHDVVCCWCFNVSSRMRNLANELDLRIQHRTFVLQESQKEMAQRWGAPSKARHQILDHWSHCRRVSDRPMKINIDAMRGATFDYPHGLTAALACKAAERLRGSTDHWDMFDQLQIAHLSEARNIADASVVKDVAEKLGYNLSEFEAELNHRETARAVELDRQLAREYQVRSIPAIIVRETGTRLVNGPLEDLHAQLESARRLVGA